MTRGSPGCDIMSQDLPARAREASFKSVYIMYNSLHMNYGLSGCLATESMSIPNQTSVDLIYRSFTHACAQCCCSCLRLAACACVVVSLDGCGSALTYRNQRID